MLSSRRLSTLSAGYARGSSVATGTEADVETDDGTGGDDIAIEDDEDDEDAADDGVTDDAIENDDASAEALVKLDERVDSVVWEA